MVGFFYYVFSYETSLPGAVQFCSLTTVWFLKVSTFDSESTLSETTKTNFITQCTAPLGTSSVKPSKYINYQQNHPATYDHSDTSTVWSFWIYLRWYIIDSTNTYFVHFSAVTLDITRRAVLLLRSQAPGTTVTLTSGCISQTGCYIHEFLLHAEDENALYPSLIKHML